MVVDVTVAIEIKVKGLHYYINMYLFNKIWTRDLIMWDNVLARK